MFHITARARIVKVLPSLEAGFRRTASFSFFGEKENILESKVFGSVAAAYDVSSDPREYLYLVARAVTADVPNSNGDMFPDSELRRFDLGRTQVVYGSFLNAPLHINHEASDPTAAKGFLPDVHYNDSNPGDMHVEALVAVDRTKDPQLAEDIESGRRNEFSMGCLAGEVQCSISSCMKKATSEPELCQHLRRAKMTMIGNELVYETCRQVTFTELSNVDDAADKTATTKAMLGRIASAQKKITTYDAKEFRRAASVLRAIDGLTLDAEDRIEVAAYLRDNRQYLPEGMRNLEGALFSGN